MSTPSESLSLFGPLKPSHRGYAEQCVGFAIFLTISLGFMILNRWFAFFSFDNAWYGRLLQAPWALPHWALSPLWILFYLPQSAAMWALWRRHSLRTLLLEASLYLSQLLLLTLWSISLFIGHLVLLALVLLLLQMIPVLLGTIVFWKKERQAGQWMIPPLTWMGFIATLNMALCLMNP